MKLISICNILDVLICGLSMRKQASAEAERLRLRVRSIKKLGSGVIQEQVAPRCLTPPERRERRGNLIAAARLVLRTGCATIGTLGGRRDERQATADRRIQSCPSGFRD